MVARGGAGVRGSDSVSPLGVGCGGALTQFPPGVRGGSSDLVSSLGGTVSDSVSSRDGGEGALP